jgi:glycosyltransferase involved in cell wall biosynthesis
VTLPPRIRTALVTNIPAPYRLPVYRRLAQDAQIDLRVLFCSAREPGRDWDLPAHGFDSVFLRERSVRMRDRTIHVNPDVWGQLRTFRPQVLVTTGFNPTHLLAYAYARRHGARHVAMTDGTLDSEAKLSRAHRWLRRLVYAGSDAFVGASNGSHALYRSYGVPVQRIFKSHLCADNPAFRDAPLDSPAFDLMFCGRFVTGKNPMFAVAVARQVARRLGRPVALLLVGAGPLEPQMRVACAAAAPEVRAHFAGFARQDALPALYRSARVFLFPTQGDVWGVVANEACAAGLPVLVSPHAGCAGELVRHQDNGFVLPLSEPRWAGAAVRLLGDDALHAAMAARSRARVRRYNFEAAAKGLAAAVRASVGRDAR